MSAAQLLLHPPSTPVPGTVLLVSMDTAIRNRLNALLCGMRWKVREASGGAEAMALLDMQVPEAMLLDSWLPDLEISSFTGQVMALFPQMDLLTLDGTPAGRVTRSGRRNELLHALREIQEAKGDGVVWNHAPRTVPGVLVGDVDHVRARAESGHNTPTVISHLPGIVGNSVAVREVARLVKLVAPSNASVLIEGETGTGKELIAAAIHQLSARSTKPLVILNCAAIPEALLEAELFGHTRGAFTGAVQSRTGRIEAANGGTLFLDEIGEMPLALQAKLLRFLEKGELQRVGENEPIRVDVRLIAATHQPLEEKATQQQFRLDLYHRLAVFPIFLTALRERMEDVPMLVHSFLEKMGEQAPVKRISNQALELLMKHAWPGNIRELGHVLHRATILAEDRPQIEEAEIRIRQRRL